MRRTDTPTPGQVDRFADHRLGLGAEGDTERVEVLIAIRGQPAVLLCLS